MKLFFPVITTSILFLSCSSGSEIKQETKLDSSAIKARIDSTLIEGIRGIIEIPEILTLAIKDSGATADIPVKMGQAYTAIEEDMTALGLEMRGSPGTLFYTNDPKNFVFECVIPINKMPEQKPKNSQIVILESTRAIVYNYYGPYGDMYKAYEKLKPYINDNKLLQTGPSREFYITNVEFESDTSKWLSRIFIPVK